MSQRPEGGFSTRTVGWLAGISAVSFACAILFAIFGDEVSTTSSASADTFSRSAIGHRAFVELLRREKIPVLISQHDTGDKLAPDAPLVVAEPILAEVDGARATELREMIGKARRALLVLPKWYGPEDPQQPAYLNRVYLLPEDEVEPILGALGLTLPETGGVLRPGASALAAGVESKEDHEWAKWNRLKPDLLHPQLLDNDIDGLSPVLGLAGRRALLARVEFDDDTDLWILSDPDLLSNHGLLRGDNAAMALALIADIRDQQGAVVFDETMHGFKSEPSLWRVLFEFPLGLATIQALLAVGFLVWAATGRFGKPVTGAGALAPGKEFLIDNTAALLRFGGHASAALQRYLQTSVQEVARTLHAPASLDGAATTRWLDELAGARGLAVRLTDLERLAAEAEQARGADRQRRVVAAARRIHSWRQEMTHGSGDRPRHR